MMMVCDCTLGGMVDCVFALRQPQQALLRALVHLRCPHSSLECTVSKPELAGQYDVIDTKCNLAQRACHRFPAKAGSLSVSGF